MGELPDAVHSAAEIDEARRKDTFGVDLLTYDGATHPPVDGPSAIFGMRTAGDNVVLSVFFTSGASVAAGRVRTAASIPVCGIGCSSGYIVVPTVAYGAATESWW